VLGVGEVGDDGDPRDEEDSCPSGDEPCRMSLGKSKQGEKRCAR
jgi:hypothetical protein